MTARVKEAVSAMTLSSSAKASAGAQMTALANLPDVHATPPTKLAFLIPASVCR